MHEEIAINLSRSTGSESAINFLVQKYRDCRAKHQKCSPPRSLASVTYPSRLLDLGTGENGLVVLRETCILPNEDYACLSHCWGDFRPLTLNSDTRSILTAGIQVAALPKTFRDAIVVTRSLCIRYLWIDSLYMNNLRC